MRLAAPSEEPVSIPVMIIPALWSIDPEATRSTVPPAAVFRSDWAPDFHEIREIYLCYDRDEAGQRGALRVAQLLPHAKLVELPEEVGETSTAIPCSSFHTVSGLIAAVPLLPRTPTPNRSPSPR